MKKCTNCGFESDDSFEFCAQCGSALPKKAEVTENVDVTMSAPVESGIPTSQENVSSVEESPVPKKKKKKKFLFILIPILIVLLIGGGIATYFIFFMSSPVFDIIKAGINTVESESFTFEMDIDGRKFDGKAVINFDDKDLQLLMEDDYGNVMGIYDRTSFEIYYDEYGFYNEETGMYENSTDYDIDDVSVLLEAFFDAWTFSKETLDSKDIDWDAFFDLLEDVFDRDADDLREDVEEHVDLEKATDAIKQAFVILADEDWLEETLGLEEEKKDGATHYSFDVDFEKLAETIEDVFADCGESDEFEYILEELLEELEEMSDEDISVKCEVVIEDDYISEASLRFSGDGWSEKLKVEISDVGETDLDEDELEEYLDECEENSGVYELPDIPDGGVIW